MNLWIKRAFVVTIPMIATNYWFQYKRRQSTQTMATNVYKKQLFALRSADLRSRSSSRQKPFSNAWFEPFVTIKPAFRMQDMPPGIPGSSQHLGSGVIINSRGFVYTVLVDHKGYTNVLIELSDGRVMNGRVIDNSSQMVIIQIVSADTVWPFIEISDPSTLEVDDTVFAVGFSKYGLYNQLLDGVITCPQIDGKDIKTMAAGFSGMTLIAHSAPFTDQNYGSALVTPDGKVVGINVNKASKTSFYALSVNNPFFAIIMKDIDQYLIANADKSITSLGVVFKLLDTALKEELKTHPDYRDMIIPENGDAIIIWWMSEQFRTKCCANKMRRYDVIVGINGFAIDCLDQLYEAIDELKCYNPLDLHLSDGNVIRILPLNVFGRPGDKRKLIHFA